MGCVSVGGGMGPFVWDREFMGLLSWEPGPSFQTQAPGFPCALPSSILTLLDYFVSLESDLGLGLGLWILGPSASARSVGLCFFPRMRSPPAHSRKRNLGLALGNSRACCCASTSQPCHLGQNEFKFCKFLAIKLSRMSNVIVEQLLGPFISFLFSLFKF